MREPGLSGEQKEFLASKIRFIFGSMNAAAPAGLIKKIAQQESARDERLTRRAQQFERANSPVVREQNPAGEHGSGSPAEQR